MTSPDRDRLRRAGRRATLARALFLGAWLLVGVGVLYSLEGPFWRSAEAWFRQARAAAEEGDWDTALNGVRAARDLDPANAGLSTFEGYALLGLDRPGEAVESFSESLALTPSDTEASLGLAEALLEVGDSGHARKTLKSMPAHRVDESLLVRRAQLAEAAGDPATALSSLEKVASSQNRPDRIRLTVTLGRWDRAAQLLLEAMSEEGDRPELRARLAWALQSGGRFEEAEAHYLVLLAAGDLQSEHALRFAWLLNEAGRHREALEALEGAGDEDEVRVLRVQTALWDGDLDRAQHDLGFAPASSDPRLVALRADLEAAREHEAELERERTRRAAAAQPPSDPDQALQYWASRLQWNVQDGEARRELVALLEAAERFTEARDIFLAGRNASDVDSPADLLHLARLDLWAGRPHEAVGWFERYEAAENDGPRTDSLSFLLASALFDAGRPEQALSTVRPSAESPDADSPTLLLAARAATAVERPGEAVRYLERLADRDFLDDAQLSWLGGLYRRVGERERALETIAELMERNPEDPTLLRAMAEMRLEQADYEAAVELYSRMPLEPDDPSSRELAYALAEMGRTRDAVMVYRAYLELLPDDHEARLSLARVLAGSGAEADALVEYHLYVLRTGSTDVALEIAHSSLAVGDHHAGEHWARSAVESTGSWEAQLALAASLRYLGRTGEAAELLSTLAERPVTGASGALWRAQVARLRDRPLAAQTVLYEALGVDEAGDLPELWMLLAEVSLERGDVGRAQTALRAAVEQGAATHRVAELLDQVDGLMRPQLAVTATVDWDRADLSRGEWGGLHSSRPGLGSLRVQGAATRVALSQGGFEADVTSLSVAVDSFYVSPELRVGARVGADLEAGGDTRLTGSVEAERTLTDGSRVGLSASRYPLWAGARSIDPLRYARIRALSRETLDLSATDVRLSGTMATGIGSHLQIEGGRTSYSDGNARSSVYAHYQWPLNTSVGRWIALQPNLYAEDFSAQEPSYVSPDGYLSVGLRTVGVIDWRGGRLETAVNPHYFRLARHRGLGIEAQAHVIWEIAPFRLQIGGLYFRQEELYDLGRVTAGVSLPLGGTDREDRQR